MASPASVAVFYLARLAEGPAALQRFFASYRNHPAGMSHELVVIAKTDSEDRDLAKISDMAGVPHRLFRFPDDGGMDIHAYAAALRATDCEYGCFLNTFTQLRADDWLAKLHAGITTPGVGLVGATGSYESLHDSWKILNAVSWCCLQRTAYDPAIAAAFEWYLKMAAARWLKPGTHLDRRLLAGIKAALRLQADWKTSLATFEDQVWTSLIAPGGPAEPWAAFPRFPNPHIRTNAFMVAKQTFEELTPVAASKLACCRFESGRTGLSRHVAARGLGLLVVGSDGQGYPVDAWPESGTFRSGVQENLLATDNQTDAYDSMTTAVQRTHRVLSWGGYLVGHESIVPPLFSLTTRGPASDILREHQGVASLPRREPRISVVIPTRGRIDLVRQAIHTVVQQQYDRLQLVVFGNGCAGKDAELVRLVHAMAPGRAAYHASESFLSVTDSWNRAINLADGDYVLLMGDDDGLAPGYCSRIAELATQFDQPELIVSNLYQFCHPGTCGDHRLRTLPVGRFVQGSTAAFLLPTAEARQSVESSLRLQRRFFFNMQAYTMSRRLLDRVRGNGPVFRSSFPDYYLANVALALSERTVVEPRPLAIQSVSAGSFGSNLFAGTVDDGMALLNNDLGQDPVHRHNQHMLLPYDQYTTNVFLTMGHVRERLGVDWPVPDVGRYRRNQVLQTIDRHRKHWISWAMGRASGFLLQRLSLHERAWAVLTWTALVVDKLLPRRHRRWYAYRCRSASQYDFTPCQHVLCDTPHASMPQAYETIRLRLQHT
jgi:hypothetical protein